MQEQLALQKILFAKYEEARGKNPSFSRRAFSRRLGLSPGAISELFNGQRKVSIKLAERIANRLGLDPQERAELFGFFPKRVRSLRADDKIEANYLQLSADQFKVIGDWYHFAILTLMRSRKFKSDSAWIAKRLNINQNQTKEALARLQRLELIKADEKGELRLSKAKYRTSDDVANFSVRKAHTQYLEKAREALEILPIEERDFTSLMLTLSRAQLPRAKELIRKFQDDLSAELEAKPQSEVYQLCMQLFPLTQKEEN